MTYRARTRIARAPRPLLIGGVVLLLIAIPVSAQAFFSFVTNAFASQTAGQATDIPASTTRNAQTIALLEPNMTTTTGRGGASLAIADNQALAVPAETPQAGTEKTQPAKESLYVVRTGDTLSAIASLFDISEETIRLANDISADGVIHPGDMLEIPPIDGVPYTIKKGDSLSSIADTYNVDADEILAANYVIDAESIQIGETLFIPNASATEEINTNQKKRRNTTTPQESQSTPARSYYSHPLAGRGTVTQGYHGRWRAIDYGAPIGTEIVASASGVVRVSLGAGWNGGYGHHVVISHDNGSQTMYAHMSDPIVSVGETVAQGQVIGYSGNTGRSTGPHLHFEIRNAGVDVPRGLRW